MDNQGCFTIDEIKRFVDDEMKLCESIKLEDMPEYKLYISQIEEFFDKKLGKGPNEEDDKKVISKTMIQNYIKDGLLMPPEGKCYNRNHMILLTLIYNLKSILTIKDIKKLLNPILTGFDDEKSSEKIEHIYDSYVELIQWDLNSYPESLADSMNVIRRHLDNAQMADHQWEKLQQLLLVLILIAQSNFRKKLAEHIIGMYFTTEEDDKK